MDFFGIDSAADISESPIFTYLKNMLSGINAEDVDYTDYAKFVLSDETEEKEETKEIKGVDINEVVSMYEAQRANIADFTGYSPKEDIRSGFNAQN